jgi:hypothetical protein
MFTGKPEEDIPAEINDKISWATKDAYNEAVLRLWSTAIGHLVTYPLEVIVNRLVGQEN